MRPPSGTRRVFKQFAWLKAGSGKVALSRIAHQRVRSPLARLLTYTIARYHTPERADIGWLSLFRIPTFYHPLLGRFRAEGETQDQTIFSQHFLSLLYVTLAFGSLQDSMGQPL